MLLKAIVKIPKIIAFIALRKVIKVITKAMIIVCFNYTGISVIAVR